MVKAFPTFSAILKKELLPRQRLFFCAEWAPPGGRDGLACGQPLRRWGQGSVVLAGRPACGPYGSVRHSSPGTNRCRRGGSPARGFISALCKGGGIHAQHGWWVSSPQGCVFLQKHLPVANGLLWREAVVHALWEAALHGAGGSGDPALPSSLFPLHSALLNIHE